jgi:hypothetical protein
MTHVAKRARRFELLTSSLGSWHSTTELRPQLVAAKGFTSILLVAIGPLATMVATDFAGLHNSLTRRTLRHHGGCHSPPFVTSVIVAAPPRSAKRVVPRFHDGHFGRWHSGAVAVDTGVAPLVPLGYLSNLSVRRADGGCIPDTVLFDAGQGSADIEISQPSLPHRGLVAR